MNRNNSLTQDPRYVCPFCKQRASRRDDEYYCENCERSVGRRHPNFDDFLLDEPFDDDFHEFYEGAGTEGDEKGGPRISAKEFKVPNVLQVLPDDVRPDRWIDVGCGGGWIIEALEPHLGPDETVGIDISATRLREANRRNPDAHFVRCPAENIPYPDDSFDLITCLDVIEHVPEPEALLAEIGRLSSRLIIKFPIEDTLFDRFQKDCWWPLKRRVKNTLGYDVELDPFEPHLRRYNFKEARATLVSSGFRPVNEHISEDPWKDNHATMYPPAYNITPTTPLLRRLDFHLKRAILVSGMRLTDLVSEQLYYQIFNSGIYFYCERN